MSKNDLIQGAQLGAERDTLYGEYRSSGGSAVDEGRRRHLELILKRSLAPVPRDWPLLDLGCGDGLLLDVATKLGFSDVSGCDVAPEQVSATCKRALSVTCCDLFDGLQLRTDQSVGVIVTFDVLEHLTRLEQLKLRAEVHRVLFAHGLWLIHVPNALSPFYGAVRHGDLTHECAFTPSSAEQLLGPAGFDVSCADDGPVPRGWASAARWLAWRAIRLGLSALHAVETGSLHYPALTRNMLVVAQKRHVGT